MKRSDFRLVLSRFVAPKPFSNYKATFTSYSSQSPLLISRRQLIRAPIRTIPWHRNRNVYVLMVRQASVSSTNGRKKRRLATLTWRRLAKRFNSSNRSPDLHDILIWLNNLVRHSPTPQHADLLYRHRSSLLNDVFTVLLLPDVYKSGSWIVCTKS